MSAKKINCPHCKKPSLYGQDNPYRPFCSERCQLIDLGAWASEKFRLPSLEPVDTEVLEKELRKQGDGDIQ